VGFLDVVKHVTKLHRPEAVKMRAMGVAFDFCEGVMLPMDRDPFPGRQATRQPDSEAEPKRDCRVKLQRLMRGAAMQVDRGAENSDLRNESRCEDCVEE
jgi:hypothetical protein